MGNQNIQLPASEKKIFVNGYEITFSPTDPAFCESLVDLFESLERQSNEFSQKASALQWTEVFSLARALDAAIRQKIDDFFGPETCAGIFGSTSVCALAEGLPLWVNLLLAIMDVIQTEFDVEKKATNPRIQKYINKYQKNERV